MKKISIICLAGLLLMTSFTSCRKFLDKEPLDAPSLGTYWANTEQALLWVNNLYNGLGGVEESIYEAYSDNGFGRAGAGANNIANGLFETIDARVAEEWSYNYIRLCLEFFANVDRVPNLNPTTKSELMGQVRFIIAYRYYKMITFFRDVPLVTELLPVEDADLGKSNKEEVLAYILEQLNAAINELPLTWPSASNGRITKGAAMALKARVLLYNNRWSEAAATAKQIMDLNIYRLHPNFNELFLSTFNNATREVILARQYAEIANTHDINLRFAPVNLNGNALILPTAELEEAFQMNDGLSKSESPLFTPLNPYANRDPRYYHTFLRHGDNLNGSAVNMTGSEYNFAFTYLYFKKYIAEFKDRFRPSHVNWSLFRYADVLLMFAEAKNEDSGPANDVYNAIDSIRVRAGMPVVDRVRYATKESLREFIRNERRVELAGEGLRYFDIIRWRIAQTVLNKTIFSTNIEQWTGNPRDANNNPILKLRQVQIRVFDPSKHYVWPIPQTAIDRSKLLTQHTEWQ